MSGIGMKKTTQWTFDQALERIPELLKGEGFGILSQIDVKATLKEKIGADFRRYRILGACNPHLAYRALTQLPEVGVLLPCNVTVWEGDDGKAVVNAIDPMETLGAAQPALAPIAAEVREKLVRVLERIG